MADHKDTTHHEHGSMDISDHQKTFAGFIRVMVWGATLSVLAVIFMALVNA